MKVSEITSTYANDNSLDFDLARSVAKLEMLRTAQEMKNSSGTSTKRENVIIESFEYYRQMGDVAEDFEKILNESIDNLNQALC